jgi:hypothetical protein
MDTYKFHISNPKIQTINNSRIKMLISMIAVCGTCLLLWCGRPEPHEQATYTILSTCQLPGYAEDIALSGNYAYIANGQAGLQIIDISDPESTALIGEYITGKSAQGVAIRDSLAFIATASGNGLVVVNIENPAACSLLGADPGYTEYRVFALPDTFYVYIAALDFFIIENCSIPQYPYYDERVSTPGDARGIFVYNSLAFVACEQMGLYIYYTARPDSAVYLVGSIDTPSNAQNVYVSGDLAYVADGRGGLIIIDISDPAAPFITGIYNTPEYANNVHVVNDLAYVADGDGGIQVVDVSDPADPVLYGMIETSYASDVVVRDSLVYIADRDLGLIIATEGIK